MTTISASQPNAPPRWRPLEAIERRVLGVLVEKAKTTPENYPLSLNSLSNGCNQKSNRSPLMQLEEDRIEEALERLRGVGAVAVIQGTSRVDKYRHLAYDWLGVDKVELAVMAELLLRGAQTVGELRGRAARMEPIKDLGELRPVLDGLQTKRLIVYLTPEGRGCVVTHTLYQERELEKLRREHVAGSIGASCESADVPPSNAAPPAIPVATAGDAAMRAGAMHGRAEAADLAEELGRLREDVAMVKCELMAARAEFESTSQQLRRDLDELNRQLGV